MNEIATNATEDTVTDPQANKRKERVNLTSEQQKYFSKSMVRNDNGELKVVYHGSPNDFTEFSYDFLGKNGTCEGKGFYFTDKKEIADTYGEKGKVYKVYLNITKPLSSQKLTITKANLKKFIKALDPDGNNYLTNYGDVQYEGYNYVLNEAVNNEYESSDNDVDLISVIATNAADTKRVNTLLYQVLGYDGIIEDNTKWGGDQTIYIPFSPNQVKFIDNLALSVDEDIRFNLKDALGININNLSDENFLIIKKAFESVQEIEDELELEL